MHPSEVQPNPRMQPTNAYAVQEFLLRPVEPQVELKGTFAHMTARSTILKTSDHVSRAIRFALSWLL
jgi:hypothetical protein